MSSSILSFLAGALIAGGGVWYWMEREAQEMAMLFALGDSATAHERAMQAYHHEEAAVAIWELRHLAHMHEDHLRRKIEGPKTAHLQIFLTHGRLAKLYGDNTNAQRHAQIAIDAYRNVFPTNNIVTNATTLLEWVKKFDDREKPRPRF